MRRTGRRLAMLVSVAAISFGMALQVGRAEDSELYVNFTFDDVDIATFAKLVGAQTGRRFAVAGDVDGSITVVSPRVRRDDAYPLFVSILESAGCSIVQDGDLHRIVKLADRPTPMAPVVGTGEAPPAEGVVTKIFQLEHVSVSQVRKLLEPKVRGGKSGAVGAIDETNHLIVTDTAESIRRVARIIEEIDRPGLARVTEVIPLTFVSAEELASTLTDTLEQTSTRGQRLRNRLPAVAGESSDRRQLPSVVASPHANSLLLVGTRSQLDELKAVIKQMDVDTPSGRGRLNAIFLKYISAADAAKSLNALLDRTPGSTTTSPEGGHRIAIEPSDANNALLVDASPGDFNVVQALIEQLDLPPEQVHIEVVIAELTEGENLDLGVDMAAIDMPSVLGDTALQGLNTLSDSADALMNAVQQGMFPGGLTVGVAHGSRVAADGSMTVGYPGIININAIKRDSRFRIRSNPSLTAQNNREASVSIVNEIPVLTSTIEGAGDGRDVIQNIKRIDVGIKLTLTPHIIPGNLVRMELNPSIEAVIDEGPDGQPFAPTIAKREVSTTVTVADGDTIVIAGLTREDEVSAVRRIPVLGSLPLVGWMFRRTVESMEETNVLILVKPVIVNGSAAAARLRESMTAKTGLEADEQSTEE